MLRVGPRMCDCIVLVLAACESPRPAPDPPPTPPPVAAPPATPPAAELPAAEPWRDIAMTDAAWVAFRGDATVLVARTQAGLGEYVVATGALQAELPAPRYAGAPAAWSASAGLLAFSGDDGLILRRLDGGAPDRTIAFAGASALAFSPTGDRLVATRSEAGVVPRAEVFDAKTGRMRERLQPFGKRRLDYDTGFRMIPAFVGADRLALLLANDTPSEAHLAVGPFNNQASAWARFELTSVGDEGGVAPSLGLALAVSPDGATIAAGDLDGQVFLLEPATGQPPTAIAVSGGDVTALAFAPTGAWLAAAADDGTLTVLAMPSRARLIEVAAPEGGTARALAADERS
jgi:hypothetical protein